MGIKLKYSAADSAQLIQAMTNNVQVASDITDRLSSGCSHLMTALDSGELQGAAYTAGKGLFSEIIIPSITKLEAAIDDTQVELESYKAADATVSSYGRLDMDELKQLKALKEKQLDIAQKQIKENEQFFTQASALLTGQYSQLWTQTNGLYELTHHLQMGIDEVQEKIEKLECFVYDVARYFTDSLTVLNLAIQGAKALSQVIVDVNGNYYTVGVNMDWVGKLKNSQIRTIARGDDLQESLIRQSAFELMLSEEGDAYYRKQLRAFLKDKPASDWPRLIEEYNRRLMFDDEGNILFWTYVGDEVRGQMWLVLKNGEFDAAYTKRLNEEVNSEQWQHVKENALELLSGVASVIAGALLIGSGLALGSGGFVLSVPTAGLSAVATTGTASATIAAGGTLVLGGVAVTNNAIIKIAAANASIQVSFAKNYEDWQKNKKTSKTHKTFEARVNGRKVKVRIDSEPLSRKFQVQSGSGKSGYDINKELRIDKIFSKSDIIDWVKDTPQLNRLSKSAKQTIIDEIWKAFQRYYSNIK